MKRVALAAALLLLLPVLVVAQGNPCSNPGFQYVTTLNGQLDLPAIGGMGAGLNWDIIVERLAGETRYVIVVESIRFSGNPDAVNAVSTADLFKLMAEKTVATGTAAGYTTCTPACADSVKVSHAMCVSRIGTGTGTKFAPCGTECTARYYKVCCSGGPVVITPLQCDTSICTGCQGTCN